MSVSQNMSRSVVDDRVQQQSVLTAMHETVLRDKLSYPSFALEVALQRILLFLIQALELGKKVWSNICVHCEFAFDLRQLLVIAH